MQFLTTTLVASALAIAAVQATSPHDSLHTPSRRDHALSKEARRQIVREYLDEHPEEVVKRSKTCKNKKSKSHKDSKSKSSSSSSHKSNDNSKSDQHKAKNTSKESKSSSSSSGSTHIAGGKGKGLFNMKFASSCQPDATDKHPNGSQDFLNCGITSSSGWNPPDVKFSDLKILSADEAAKNDNFKACQQYAWAFKDAEKNHDVPAVLLMSFAMQESSCNAKTTGGNGEQGLMQITPDKCGGAPKGNCKDVWFNIDAGAKYFKSQMDDNNGNVLAAIGSYNGWTKGLTVASATAAAKHGQCHAQNNLDYIFQLLDGWLLGAPNPYDMGKYQNLRNCN